MNSEFDSVSKKRKRIEQGELKRLSMIDKIVSKKNQLFEERPNVTSVKKSAPKAPYLEFPPIDGSTFYKIGSPDCFQTGYIEVYRPQSAATERFRARTERSLVIDTADSTIPSITQEKVGFNLYCFYSFLRFRLTSSTTLNNYGRISTSHEVFWSC